MIAIVIAVTNGRDCDMQVVDKLILSINEARRNILKDKVVT